ncbi:hypothetical protein [Parasedimentitalea psychrophila]|uniref:Uncharacterized protein n=1 Tax=Parasedimentitalea psychrophila TaxID=2997337 RepID=A0A9Y2L404_9RHOB|nr:hypothetical protein [Parasedimentitalea psychrophila]WIY27698.1 hypothetical protein QPJ95_20490 [Parasedimentitalea psychrophila]
MAMLKLSNIGCGLGQVFHQGDPSGFCHQCLDDTVAEVKSLWATNFCEQAVATDCQLVILRRSA